MVNRDAKAVQAAVGASAAHSGERPIERVVLLGASNLTRGISTVVRLSQLTFGRPLEILAALGHGRSYGMTSRVLLRELPGIIECGLWDSLVQRPALPTAALLTDIGNDLFYGATVEEILGWVEAALDRLAAQQTRIVMTLLPTDTADTISPWRFHWMRRLMFRSCTLELAELKRLVVEINERLTAIATSRGVRVVSQRADWYGLDPIHIRMSRWPRAWSEILAAWRNDSEKFFSPEPSLRRWFYLRSLAPLERTILGRMQRAAQPAGRLPDGTTISFF